MALNELVHQRLRNRQHLFSTKDEVRQLSKKRNKFPDKANRALDRAEQEVLVAGGLSTFTASAGRRNSQRQSQRVSGRELRRDAEPGRRGLAL